jgi:hypothetical protein
VDNPEASNELLKNKYNLHQSEEVSVATRLQQSRTGEKVPQNPLYQIESYLDRLDNLVNPPSLESNPEFDRKQRNLGMIRNRIYDRYVVKAEDIPEGYWENQRRIKIEKGQESDLAHGGWESFKRRNAETVIADQINSIDRWIDYLAYDDEYPTALKYWTLRSVLNMSEFDKEKDMYPQRSKGTTKAFPDLNQEALAYVLDAVANKYKGTADFSSLDPEESKVFQDLLQRENFPKLYKWATERTKTKNNYDLSVTEGKWVKFEQNSDPELLTTSLHGYGTGWCTAGEAMASSQLEMGDFYVYYSKDDKGDFVVPRVAVRRENNKIAELRGVVEGQHLDQYVNSIVEEKLREFPDGEEYQKKVEDMKRLTQIDTKIKEGESLNTDELRFIYEVDDKIQGFGEEDDPRVKRILSTRDVHADLVAVFQCQPEQISFTFEQAIKGDVLYHYGDLLVENSDVEEELTFPKIVSGNINLKIINNADKLQMPEKVGGNVNFKYLMNVDGLRLPRIIHGSLKMQLLKTTKGLIMPEKVDGDIDLDSLQELDTLVLPTRVGGKLELSSLRTVEHVTLPTMVGDSVDLDRLSNAEHLTLPTLVGGDLSLNGIADAENIVFPDSVDTISLNGLKSVDNLKFPESIPGSLSLRGLSSGKGLESVLPKSIGRYLYLDGLVSLEDLNLSGIHCKTLSLNGLESVDGIEDLLLSGVCNGLMLDGLESADGLVFPERILGTLSLTNLLSAEGLVLPKIVEGDLFLSGITTAESLILPDIVGGDLYLDGLESAENLHLPHTIKGDLVLGELQSAKDLKLPHKTTGGLFLDGLTNAQDLILPEEVGGDLYLSGLETIDGLVLPSTVRGNLLLERVTTIKGLKLPDIIEGGLLGVSSISEEEKESLAKKYPDLVIF